MTTTGWTRGLVMLGLGGLLIAGCATGSQHRMKHRASTLTA